MKTYLSWKRIRQFFWFTIANLPMPGHGIRPFFVKLGGVKVISPKCTFIGRHVSFDSVHPELIIIEPGVRITEGVCVLSHFINPATGTYRNGEVRIKKGAFIGIRTIICNSVVIGERAIVGAGSIVTKDIPDNEVWAGNPARLIRSR